MGSNELKETEGHVPIPFVYNATPLNAYDGDTIAVRVDLGFDIEQRITLRLARINAPEVRGPERQMGLKARDFLFEKLFGKSGAVQKPLIVRTYKDKKEKYGRYLADVFLNGVCLNDLMVQEGHAVYRKY
jgi:micrococcal nuclease